MENEILQQILGELGAIKGDLGKVTESQAVLERGVNELRRDMTRTQLAIDKLDRGQAVIEQRLSRVEERLTGVEERLTEVETDLAKVKEDVAFTKEAATRMEIDHGTQLRGLWEGHGVIQTTLNNHSKALARLEDKVDRLDANVGVHTMQLQALS